MDRAQTQKQITQQRKRAPGGGRKATHGERKENLTIRLTPTLRAFLDSQEESAGEHIEAALRRSRAFRDWQRETK